MNVFPSRPSCIRAFALRTCAFAGATLAFSAIAEPVADPISARIAKGSVTVDLQPAATGLVSPVLAIAAPGDATGRLFIIDQAGLIRIVQGGNLLPAPFLDVTTQLVKLQADFDERGLLGLAFHPGFSDPQSPGHGRLFTYTSEPARGRADFPNPHLGAEPPNHHSVVAAWKVSAADANTVNLASRTELMRIDEPQFNHNGGMVAFGPDGFLYISLGDGGAANDLGPGHNPETGNAQDPKIVLGKILRIDVHGKNSANGKYGVPADNPFVAAGGGLPEIYALGLRNPWRFSFDGNQLLAADVGQNKVEFVHRIERGGNYGWRLKEGTFAFKADGTIDSDKSGLPAGLRDPVLQYDHDDGISITGGFVYRGKALPELTGKYVFGDWRSPKSTKSGRLFYANLATGKIEEFRIGKEDREPGFLIKGFGQDGDGELYVLGSKGGPSGASGVVLKLAPLATP